TTAGWRSATPPVGWSWRSCPAEARFFLIVPYPVLTISQGWAGHDGLTGHAGGTSMIAQELHPFPYQPEGAAPPSQSPPPRHLGRWRLAALVLGVVLAGAATGAGGASELSRATPNAPAPAPTAATTPSRSG